MVPHPLALLLAFFTWVGFTQNLVNAKPQVLAHGISSETLQTLEPTSFTSTVFPTFVQATEIRPSPTISPTATPTLWLPNPVSTYKSLIDFCNRCQVDNDQWRYALNQISFPSDVTDSAQEQLPNPVEIRPSCNFDLQNQPKAIVIHYTEGSLDATLATFQQPHNSSAHYVIDRDGKVYQVIPEQFAAYHVNCYGNRTLCMPSCPVCADQYGSFVEPRSQTIGIELVNLGHVDPRYYSGSAGLFEDYNNSFGYRFWEDYPEAQLHSLQILVEDIRSRWNIPLEMVMGHSRINNNVDPGPALNLFWPRYGNPSRPGIFSR